MQNKKTLQAEITSSDDNLLDAIWVITTWGKNEDKGEADMSESVEVTP